MNKQKQPQRTHKAYRNRAFLDSRDGRPLRILAEYLEPEARFDRLRVKDTIIFFGSARTTSRHAAEAEVAAARRGGAELAAAETHLRMSRYYEDARALAGRLTTWSKSLEGTDRRFVICTGGGPGIMEAGNRGAFDVNAKTVGLNITLPHEQFPNSYITPDLCFQFRYFALRKLHFLKRAKALVAFPGGYGTFDELFETLTLIQTRTVQPMPVILVGKKFWNRAFDAQFLADEGVIDLEDRDLFVFAETAKEIWNHILKWHKDRGTEVLSE